MMRGVRWALLLAAVHQRPGWQILGVVVLGLLAERLAPRLAPAHAFTPER
jgi:hypothetical protein